MSKSWQTELDRVFGQLFEGQPVMTGTIRPKMITFIQDLLDQKARKIKALSGMKFPRGERPWCVECSQRVTKKAISILKEE